ncbi:MAG: restriction endonuclease [Candidatus Aminicenantes bacterium]|nr:restriction endonuclease [Candidatus Aminicenantes bacterium]
MLFSCDDRKNVVTARGKVNIDVYATDPGQSPKLSYLCECKNWNKKIPKSVVYTFRSIVSDTGANWGLIITRKGFQKGAFEAAKHTNVMLLDWQQFQELFVKRWYKQHMIRIVSKEAKSLVEYTEPLNSSIQEKVLRLPKEKQEIFFSLQKRYSMLAFICLELEYYYKIHDDGYPNLPLINEWPNLKGEISKEILLATSFEELLQSLIKIIRLAIEEFDSILKV